MSVRPLLVSLICLWQMTATIAQNTELNFPPPQIPPVIRAVKIVEKITLDGLLNETVWQQAQVLSGADFFRMEPKQGGDFEFKTSVRLLF
ncbi:MAG: hypothetical protein IPL27_04560 [Lewinellaceae bacterium]|nr:hypothetical protein [Lewinellaceae bacterium]